MSAAADLLHRAWRRRGPLAWLLSPFALLFGALGAGRRLAYRRGWKPTHRLPVPVLVVGNVVAGGAGKTPVVIALVQHLQRRGLRVGVVSRGYGRRTPEGLLVQPGSDPRDTGDEPLLIARATGAPLAVDRDRAAAGRRLLAAHPELQLIVSDDGLQHLALARDLEICVFDDRGIGNGWWLPAGPLRESWPRPCDLVLHTGARPAFAGFTAQRALADAAVGRDGQRVPLAELASRQDLVAVAGIAQPQNFFDMLRARGVQPAQCIALPDHHDFEAPAPWPEGAQLLCTEKDAAKLWRVAPGALAVPLHFAPEAAFFAALDARLETLLGQGSRLSSAHGHQAA
ncbi:tetraacyldisaccharide 4'-kinase [Xenophilus sp. Marseille-Q4582]|uniref:tetraacyldisaccharide 4'-kinase n=1 Tax=Xenophilus sp. Marseille-Q4582 TaxID=2866600 RepID=UPI001CE45D71|nr:tetraacyldisaccharide 4'-kinase [Xenophilus sp. Marseille-Q4582]